MNPYFLPVACIPLGLMAVVVSGFYEPQVAGTVALLLLVSVAIFTRRDAGYFGAALTATLLCSLIWIISTGGQHAWHEGFDPMRFDWLARNSAPSSILEEPSNAWVSYPAAWLYWLLGQNIATVALLNFSLIAFATVLFSRRFGQQYPAPFLIAFLLTPELIYHSGMLAKEPLNFAALLFFAIPLLEIHERRYSFTGLFALAIALVLAVLTRPEIMLIFCVCMAVVLVLRRRHKALPVVLLALTAGIIFVLMQDVISAWLELTAAFSESVLETEGSIDPLKQFVRNATASASIADRLLIAPVKLAALMFGPLPKASFIDLFTYWQAGVDPYVLFINFFNKVTACMLLGAAWVMWRRKPTLDGANKVFLTIGAVGIVIAALVPPFLHLRYRIPYTPFLLLPMIRIGETGGLLRAALFVYAITEIMSVLFYALLALS